MNGFESVSDYLSAHVLASLPSMLVLQRIMGTTKTTAFITLVVLISTLAGFAYGKVVG